MAKRLNVNLAFSADTSKAKAQLQDLQKQLSSLMNDTNLNAELRIGDSAQRAIPQIAQLKAQLDNATTSAGTLDLSKFNESLKRSGITIRDYGRTLNSLGSEGSKAFSTLASSVMNAEIPLKRTNALLDEFVVTLKNSARWQISSNILHGLESTLSSAVGYAESLNKSLTDIRIVTGYSSDQMAEFAEQANKAAKALNTTTTRYSDAALIYYQQGLSEQEVLERTDITVKMANVTGEAAQTISDQMTAVWNNFYDGSKSLEYYSDVLTRLGADTASSTDEITEGLEKFASVTGTIGLSYEYAAASLATITATTRESASVVGTALKTLFSRIQGLKLGETLEDGTNLNKYSEALAKVGIDIKDQNGELRDMDDILDEMGAKWGTLSRDQQAALAQTVAGVRQYTQLMTLMNNWDFFQENLESAYNATGALDEQADIFAESWEAASNRVRAAAEGIYDSILDDDFIIDLMDGFGGLLEGIEDVIDGLGGMKGLFITLGALGTQIFGKQISKELTNLSYNMRMAIPGQRQKAGLKIKEDTLNQLKSNIDPNQPDEVQNAQIKVYENQAEIQKILLTDASKMNEEQKELLQIYINQQKVLDERALQATQSKINRQEELRQATNNLTGEAIIRASEEQGQYLTPGQRNNLTANIEQQVETITELQRAREQYLDVYENIENLSTDSEAITQENLINLFGRKDVLTLNLDNLLNDSALSDDIDNAFEDLIRLVETKGLSAKEEIQQRLTDLLSNLEPETEISISDWFEDELGVRQFMLGDTLEDAGVNHAQDRASAIVESSRRVIEAERAEINTHRQNALSMEQLKKKAQEIKNASYSLTDVIMGTTQGFMALQVSISTVSSFLNILNDESSTTSEKVVAGITALTTVLSTTIPLISSFNLEKSKNTIITLANTVAQKGNAVATAAVGTNAAAATVPVTTLSAALSTLMPYAAIIIGIGAALGLLVYSFKQGIDEANRFGDSIEEVDNYLKQCETNTKNLNTALTEFKTNLNDFETGIKNIESLTKGTEEYYKAISDSNEKARELIETYSLFDNYEIGTDGLIKIDEAVLDNIENDLANKLNFSKILENSAKIAYEEVELDSLSVDMGANIHDDKELRNSMYELAQSTGYNEYSGYNIGANARLLEQVGDSFNKLSKNVDNVNFDNFSIKLQEESDNLESYGISLEEITSQTGLTTDEFLEYADLLATQGRTYLSEFVDALRESASACNYYAQQILGLVIEDDAGLSGFIKSFSNGDKGLETQLLNTLSNNPEAIELVGKVSKEAHDEATTYSASGNSFVEYMKENGDVLLDYLGEEYGLNFSNREGLKWEDSDFIQKLTAYTRYGYTGPWEGLSVKDGTLSSLEGEIISGQSADAIRYDIIHFTEMFAGLKEQESKIVNLLQDEASKINNIKNADENVKSFLLAQRDKTDQNSGMDVSNLTNNLDEKSYNKLITGNPTDLLEFLSLDSKEQLATFGIENADTFLRAFKEAIKNGWSKEDYIANLRSKFEAEIEALDVDFNIDELEAYAEHLEDLEPLLEEDRELALDIAMAHMRLAESTETLAKNWDDWNKVMTSGDSLAIAKLSDDLAVVMQNMLNLTPEQFSLLPDDFVEDHWDMIQDVYNGVEGAVEGLQELAGEEILLGEIKASFNGQEISNEVKGLFAELEGMTPPQITVGTNIDQLDAEAQRYVELLNMIVQACGWTAEEASAKLLALGFNATFRETTKKIKVPRVIKTSDGSDGSEQFETIEQEISVPAIEIETLYSRFGGNIGSSSSIANSGKTAGTSGGKDDTPEKMDTTDREDMVERYKEINDSLDDVADALSDVNKLTDRLYGKNRISALKNQNALLQQEIGLLKEKASQAKAYLAQDQSRLQSAAADLGASFNFDAQGNISNYTAQMNALYDQLAAAENKFNSLGSKTAQEEYQKSTLDPLNDKISELQDAISQYDETRELIEDIENELDDKFYQWQDNNYEILTYELEIKIELNDLELKEIEYYLNKISDDFYQMAEAASLMMDKSPVIQEDLAAYGDYYEQLTSAYNAGDISQADYVEGLKESYDAIIDNLEALLELDKEMMEYYGKTVKAAQEELDKYTNRLEHLTGVLDHYKNLMDILGRNKDYASLGIILEGQAKTLKDELDVATKDYQMWVEQEAYWANQMEQTLSDPMAYELAKKNWEEAYDAMADAQDKMLTKTEEWTKALRAVLENQLAGYAQSLEDALTGGTNFDQMNNALERAQSLQEEFLTDTNKIYETEKLMRKARDDINKTNNEKAKQRLQGFIDETEELQNQTELSEFELKVQQAKYDLLLAEIALEEAQNAKSTVRLQRDSEGNFGYVYTADQAAVSDAEQQFADAQNNLYNIGLEGTYEYTEKYQQMVQEMYESLTQLQQDYLNGEFATEEEYQNAVLATKEYYYEKLKDYSYLYSEALQTDSRVAADSWAVDFEDMTLNTEMWMEHVDVYIDQVGNAFEIWAERSEAANEVVGDSLDETKEKVEEVTDASSDLKDEIVSEVIPAIEDELDSVNAATSAWAAQRAELYNVISTYEQLISTIRAAIAAQAALDNYQAKSVNVGGGGGFGTGNIGNNNLNGTGKKPSNPIVEESSKIYNYEAIVERDNGYGEFGSQRVSGTIEVKPGKTLEEAIAERHKADIATVIKTFDTGGYTGNWGPEGKLAFLHQKELVLNAADTENFLSAIGIIREISHAIDLQSLASQFSGLSSVGYNSNTSNVLEQNVHIEASFPNVSEHLEIEMALNNLVNTASQYANRK